ncbi:3-oxoadipate enol-lactonase [Chromobacterium sp. Panama]|uniref:3-oxoadipate enol-lactonase n=1 Tax=Chromobacterium sp. Panama TaxID=2161826 RepID=UPI000D2FD722|nr:3-oxoadipate enol-lactonase [Chromobacterium sp. Panama]PTU65981.1 3-oxoadipate enol-lactonase [Chromobacterium sp. Panama]
MPMLKLGTHALHYQVDGPAGAPALLLSNSLGTSLEMWRPQLAALSRRYRVLRYDARGHGGSGVGAVPPRLADLAGDALSLLDALDIERAHFCGISMGGLTGLWLGAHAPERLQCLVVSNSAAKIGASEAWRQRAAQVRGGGLAELAASAHQRWFSADFCARAPDIVEQARAWLAATAPDGYAGCCEALADADLRADLPRIAAPTLLIAGLLDPVTTAAEAEAMAAAMPNARLARLPASHLSNLEAPLAFERALLDFLDAA